MQLINLITRLERASQLGAQDAFTQENLLPLRNKELLDMAEAESIPHGSVTILQNYIGAWKHTKERKATLCPRCGLPKMKPDKLHNALSRISDVYICDDCGMHEAVQNAFGEITPRTEWPIQF